jgi:hypothetical protein
MLSHTFNTKTPRHKATMPHSKNTAFKKINLLYNMTETEPIDTYVDLTPSCSNVATQIERVIHRQNQQCGTAVRNRLRQKLHAKQSKA